MPIQSPLPPAVAPPAAHPHRWRVLLVLTSSLLLIAMDATILNVALPAIAADLEPGATELLWIVDAYGLVLAGLLVAMGGLGDRIGRRKLLTAGLVVFGVASAMAAAAPSSEALIAARALLGVGGAMIMPSTLSTLRVVFTDSRERSIAIGVWSAVAAGGFALGPVVGGALLEVADWHLVLAINVPVMAAALAATRAWVPESRNPTPGPWDPVAVGLSVAGMVALVWGIKHGGEHGFADVATLGATATAVTLLTVFVRRELRAAHPLLDVALFRDARFSGAVIAVLFTFLGLAALLLALTQFQQLVESRGPLEAGLRMVPLAAGAVAGGLVADGLVRRVGANLAVGGSFVVVAGALAALSTLQAGDAYGPIGLALGAIGLTAGIAATAGSAAIMGAAPAERAGGAAAIQETAFELGGALGIAVLGSVLNAGYRSALELPAETPDATAQAAREGLATLAGAASELGPDAAPLLQAARAAFVDGYATSTLAGAGLVLAGAAICLLVLPGRDRAATGAEPADATWAA